MTTGPYAWDTVALIERWQALDARLDALVRLSLPHLAALTTEEIGVVVSELSRREAAAAAAAFADDGDPPLVGF